MICIVDNHRPWTVRVAGAATAGQVVRTRSGSDGLDPRRERLITTVCIPQTMGWRILAR